MEYTKEKFEALTASHAEALKGASSDAIALERERVSGIMSLNGSAEFTAKAIEDGSTVGDSAVALLKSNNEALAKAKTDFEAASSELGENNEVETTDENLSAEAKKDKEADEALNQHFEGKK